jgi:hypothetical protein
MKSHGALRSIKYEKRATEAARDRELARGQARDLSRLKVLVEALWRGTPALSTSVFLAFHREASPMYIDARDASFVDAADVRDASHIGNANALIVVLLWDLWEKSREETELLTRSQLFLPSRCDRYVYIGEIRESISLDCIYVGA